MTRSEKAQFEEAIGRKAVEPTVDIQVRDIPSVPSAEWEILTGRRAKLIARKYEGGLTSEESAELTKLQQLSSEVIESAFPRPRLSADELEEIRRALENGSGEHRE